MKSLNFKNLGATHLDEVRPSQKTQRGGGLLALFTGSAALLSLKFAFLGVRVVAILFTAKFGSPIDLATISFVLAMGELGRLVGDFGTDAASVRLLILAEDDEARARTLGAVATIKLLGSLIVWPVLIAVSAIMLAGSGQIAGLLAGVLVLTAQCAGLATSQSQAADRVGYLCRRVIPYTLVGCALVAGTCILSGEALPTLSVLAGCETVIAYLLIKDLRRRRVLPEIQVWKEELCAVFRACAPFAGLGLVVGVYSRLDTIVLAHYSLLALATYTLAQRILQPIQTAATTFGAVVYRKISAATIARKTFARAVLLRDLIAIAVCVGLGSLCLSYVGAVLIESVFAEYTATILPFFVLCAALTPLALNAALAGTLWAFGRPNLVLGIGILDLIVLAAALFLFVPAHGALGASLAVLAGAIANFLAHSICVSLTLRERS